MVTMTIRSSDTRWKHTKTARSRLTNEQIAERLVRSADRLFTERVELRRDYDVLDEAFNDASGLTSDLYSDAGVKQTRDQIHELIKPLVT